MTELTARSLDRLAWSAGTVLVAIAVYQILLVHQVNLVPPKKLGHIRIFQLHQYPVLRKGRCLHPLFLLSRPVELCRTQAKVIPGQRVGRRASRQRALSLDLSRRLPSSQVKLQVSLLVDYPQRRLFVLLPVLSVVRSRGRHSRHGSVR